MAAAAKKELKYHGKPLIRKNNQLFYGNLEDRYILVLTVISSSQVEDIEVATKVKVEIQDNEGVIGKGRTYRKTERDNLYRALDIGSFWLSEALEN